VLGRHLGRVWLNSGPLTEGQSLWDDGGLGERREPRSICAASLCLGHQLGDARGGRSPGTMGVLACSGRTEAQNAHRFRSDGSMIFNRAFYLNKTRDSVWRRMKLGKP
jgi:hypothetical protein